MCMYTRSAKDYMLMHRRIRKRRVMSIKFYDTSGKYWGKFDETRGLFIPSEEVLADRKTEAQTIIMVKNHGRKQALEMIDSYHKIIKTEPQTERSSE